MRTRLLLVVVLVASACAQPTSEPVATSSTPSTPSTTAAPSQTAETTSTLPSSEETSTTRPAPNPDRNLAPDFALTLSDGSEYQLTNEVRPVYLVFWAEW